MADPQPTITVSESMAVAIKLSSLLKSAGLGESWMTLTLRDVDKAMVEALEKHGRPTQRPERGIAHCIEELGEAAKEATDAMRGTPKQLPEPAALHRMVWELCQLSAYSALLATSMRILVKEVESER